MDPRHSGSSVLTCPGAIGAGCGAPLTPCCRLSPRSWHLSAVIVSRDLPAQEEQIQTQLHRRFSEEFYTYCNVPWKIYIRKEVRREHGPLPTSQLTP